MREIKLRAWDEILKTMIYEDHSTDGTGSISLPNWRVLRGWDKIMQYTGLKDKNGKEIYEGDILKWVSGDNTIGLVEWLDGDVCFDTTPTLNGLDCIHVKGYEIIGNVYENKELLKEVQSEN